MPNDVKPVSLGNFNDVSIGETVFAIGHPDDLIWSFSSGMVSQLRPNYKWRYKNSHHFADVIQTQTPINPGNSGGPLFNKNKKLVGYILDLRNNSGGFLEQAAEIANMFITTRDTLVYTIGKHNNTNEVFMSKPSKGRSDYPLIILLNRGSASASEIVCWFF